MTAFERLASFALSVLARRGSLNLRIPSGATTSLGHGAPAADLSLNSYSGITEILKSGLTGFAEAHMDGRIDTSDLQALVNWGLENQQAWFRNPIVRTTRPVRRLWQKIKPERRHPRVRTMNDHYNLGNEFYRTWLDESMTYSSARFVAPGETLEQAQRNKYQTVAEKAGLKPGMRVLEIGCGWGGFAEYAAVECGVSVTGITLSHEQATFARKRIAKAGLADQVEIEVADFRQVSGRFDAVVSIEMIESVDETHWLPLFETIAGSLKPEGRAVMQIITIDDSEWERYRSKADFIQQYIFPGGQIPAPKFLDLLSDASGLSVLQVETFGLDYARTLAEWRRRFLQAWPSLISEAELDERFRRMWDLYLLLCEAGFRMGRINVEHRILALQPESQHFEKYSSGSPS